jgi:threonine aldolase
MIENQYGFAFASDNTAPATPEALNAYAQASSAPQLPSYGSDAITLKAKRALQDWFECEAEIFFVFSGTAANALAIGALRQPFESVFCTNEAHIEKDESAAPEFFSQGLKLHLVGDERGDKLDLEKARHILKTNRGMHSAQPRVISVTQTTEFGTHYSSSELQEIREFANEHKLHVHMDGARFANALAFSGASPAQASWKAGVDVLSLGGTKNGVCTSEVVVFFKPELALGFLNRRKQGGQLLSKMRYLSAPWAGALPNFIARARYANAMALKLAAIFRSAGLHLAFPVEANGVFVHLAPAQVQYLEQKDWHFYWFYGEDKSRRAGDTADVYRFMCAWNTDIAALEALKIDLAQAVALV